MALAYSYVRFSSKPQEFGDSLRRQIEGTEKFCKRHGLTLDTSLTLHDLGVSGFKGKNKNKGSLGEFVRLAEKGSIPPGSYLVLENLDRLSREDLRPAFTLLLRILDCKVNIATVAPEQIYRHDSLDQLGFFQAVIELSRGHSESARKSERLQASWSEKRKNIEKEIFTANAPGWVTAKKDRSGFVLNEGKAEVIRRVFQLATEGKGHDNIAWLLNQDKTPLPTRRGTQWHGSVVQKILKSRTVIGEFQLHEKKNGKRTPIGKPIQNYYPPVISERLFDGVQDAMKLRKKHKGPITNKCPNLFTGLLFDPIDGCSLNVEIKHQADGYRLVSSKGKRGVEGARYISFPYSVIEQALLKSISELKASDLAPDSTGINEMAVASGRLTELDTKIEKIKSRIKGDETADDALFDLLREFSQERVQLVNQIRELKEQAANGYGETLGDAQSIIEMLHTADDKLDFRLKLRARFASLISKIWVVLVEMDTKYRTAPKGCLIQVDFRNGAQSRQIITRSHKPQFITVKGVMIKHLLPDNAKKASEILKQFWLPHLQPTKKGGVKF